MNLRIYEILASRMRLDKEDYYGLKKELREDFLYYLECA